MGLFAREMLKLLATHRRVKLPLLDAFGLGRWANPTASIHAKSMLFNDIIDKKYGNPPRDHRTIVRHFSRSTALLKQFQSHENSHAYEILKQKGSYILSPTLSNDEHISDDEMKTLLAKNWNDATTAELVDAFKKLSYYARENSENMSDEKYTGIFASLGANCVKLTDEELLGILKYLSLWPPTTGIMASNFITIWNSLDRVCIDRLPKWSIDEMLLICDHWYQLKMTRYIQFSRHVMRKLGKKPNRLSPTNLVQTMFYINSCRNAPEHMYDFEYRLEFCIDDLNVDELGIVAMGFFKSQTQIRNPQLVARMLRKVIENVGSIHEISLSAIMKITRYSLKLTEIDLLKELFSNLIPQVPRLSLQCLVHIVLAGTNILMYNKELLHAVAGRFAREMEDARIKDIERLVFTLTIFNSVPATHLISVILRELSSPRREEEIQRYPRCLACCLQYLSVVNVYPKHLINRVLKPDFIENTYGTGHFRVGREILVLDASIEAEVPDYTGTRISEKMSSTLAKKYTEWVPDADKKSLSATDRFLLEVMETCQEVLGSSTMVHVDHVLPHYRRADIIICLDEYDTPVPTSPVLSELPFGTVKFRPDMFSDGPRWLALVPTGWNYYIRDTTELLGSFRAKLRQLERIGYTPIVVPWFDWAKRKDPKDREDYIKEKIFN